MTRTLAIAALLLTAQCSRQDQPAPPPANDAAAAPVATARAEIPSLKGEWRVAGASGLTATFSGAQLVLAEGCVRRAWTFSQKRNAVTFTSAPGGSSNCGRLPSAAMDNAFGPLADANMAVFSADGNKVTLSGLGGSLELERR